MTALNYQDTSRLAHQKNLAEGIYLTQNSRILKALRESDSPKNTRQLSVISKIERSSIPACMRTLIARNEVCIIYEDKCPYTQRKTKFYQLVGQDETND